MDESERWMIVEDGWKWKMDKDEWCMIRTMCVVVQLFKITLNSFVSSCSNSTSSSTWSFRTRTCVYVCFRDWYVWVLTVWTLKITYDTKRLLPFTRYWGCVRSTFTMTKQDSKCFRGRCTDGWFLPFSGTISCSFRYDTFELFRCDPALISCLNMKKRRCFFLL